MSQLTFTDWKKTKIAKGEWLSNEDYKRKKDLERKEILEKELEMINRRLNLRSHKDLEEDFEKFYEEEVNKTKSTKKRKRFNSEENSDLPPAQKKKTINREIILDTETTGLGNSDKIVEISMIELVEGIKTGRKFHSFLNPEINITKKATEIHKITNEKVENCKKFHQISEDIIKFIGDAQIIAHNAPFDRRMLNNELRECGWEKYGKNRFIDTLEISRYLFPGEKNNQDALCERFNIENHNRVNTGIHSAAEDTALLYLVYKELECLLKNKKLTPYDFIKEDDL